MIEYFFIMGGIWLLLVLFEPVVAYFDAIGECDRKYAADRAHRAEVYEQLAAMHRQSPVYQQMVRQKNVKKTGGKQQKNSKVNGTFQKLKRSSVAISSLSTGNGSTSQNSHPYGRIIQKKNKM
jgi:hypothetical protein